MRVGNQVKIVDSESKTMFRALVDIRNHLSQPVSNEVIEALDPLPQNVNKRIQHSKNNTTECIPLL